MITNNKYIRGDIGIFNKQALSYINIEDYNGLKTNKYLITKEYLQNYLQNNINEKNLIFGLIIPDSMSKSEITSLFQSIADSLELKNNFKNMSFILQHSDTITESGTNYTTFKNYLIQIDISYNNDEYNINFDLNNKKELIEGNLYYIINNKGINLSICKNNNSVCPIIILNDIVFNNTILSPLNINPLYLDYEIKLKSYIGKEYTNYYNEDISDTNYYFYNIFNFEFIIKDFIISKNIDLTNIYSYEIQNTDINDFYYYYSDKFKKYIDLTKVKSSDLSHTNDDKINISIINTAKFNLNLVSYTGNSVKNTKYIFSRSLTSYNTYPLFNIFNYEYVLINSNNTYNLYQKKTDSPYYYDTCKFPKYTTDNGTTILTFSENDIIKLFIYDNSNDNFYCCEEYNQDGMDLTLSNNNKMYILKDNFKPDVPLNIVCNLYNIVENNTFKSIISFSFTNYINKNYLINNFILSPENNNEDIVLDYSNYKTSFNGFIKFIEDQPGPT